MRTLNSMDDVERWIGGHERELHELGEQNRANDDAVHLVASLVLHGWTDDAIYEQLRELIPSNDGQDSPLADAPVLLRELRRLAATP